MAVVKKLSEEEQAFIEIIRHPLWFGEFMKELDPEIDDWEYSPYQKEMLCDFNSFSSFCCGRAIGKTESLVAKLSWYGVNNFWPGSLVYTVPSKVHMDPVFFGLSRTFRTHPFLKHYVGKQGINAQTFTVRLSNGAVFDCRIAGQSNTGANVVGLHVPIIIVDEAGLYPWGTWIELGPCLNTFNQGFQLTVSGVPTGLREKNVLFTADQIDNKFAKHRISAHSNPRYTAEDEVRNLDQYGGKDSEDYVHMVLGEHGNPSYAVFDRNRMLIQEYDVWTGTLTGQKLKEDPGAVERLFSSIPTLPRNARVALGVDLGYCYSEDTEVLTGRGWLLHKDILSEDVVACFDTVENKIVWDKPVYLWQQDYEGEMIEVDGKSTNFMVSPEHSVWASESVGSVYQPYKKLKAKELLTLGSARFKVRLTASGHVSSGPTTFKIPYYYCDRKDRKDSVREIPMTDWLKFLAWFISEGSATANRNWEVDLTQAKGIYSEEIDKVLSKLPYTVSRKEFQTQWGKTQINWRITCKELCLYLRDSCGVHSQNKKIPQFVFACSTEDRLLFLQTLLKGDGRRLSCNRAPNFTSSSVKLLDQVQHLAISLGYSSTRTFNKNVGMGFTSIMTRTENQLNRDKNIKRVSYSGKIYCLKTTTGFYVTRRKGKAALQGNTEPTVIMVFYKTREDVPWKYVVRLTLRQVDYPVQEDIIDRLGIMYSATIIGIDEGSSGKAVIQHFLSDEKYKKRGYTDKIVPIMFRSNVTIGIDDKGENIDVRAKQFAVQNLQTKVNNHDICFTSKDEELISELENTTYTRTQTGELVFKTLTARGGVRHGQDHNLSSLLCFTMALYMVEELPDALRQRQVKLYTPRWL